MKKYKEILIIFIPIIFQQLVMNIINIVDNFMVGRFSDTYISAITIINRIFNVSNSLLLGLVASCAVFIAQYNGTKDTYNAESTFKFSILSSIGILLPMIIVFIVFPEFIIGFFTNDIDVINAATIYIRLLSLSLIPYIVSQTISNAIRSIGIVKGPLYISIIMVLVKIVLNYALLYNPLQLELFGAGLALIITRIIELSLLIIILEISNSGLSVRNFNKCKISSRLAIKVVKRMLPLGINEFLYGIALAVMYKLYASYDTMILAGYSIALTYYETFRVINGSIGMTMNVFVLPLLSNDLYDKAKNKAYQIFVFGVKMAIIIGVILFALSFTIPFIYNTSLVSINLATRLLKIMGLLFPFITFHGLFYFIFRCGQDNKSIIITDSMYLLFIAIPIQYICIKNGFSIITTYLCTELSAIIKIIFCIYFIRKGNWQRNLT